MITTYIKENSYFDSVTLMLLSRELLNIEGVEKANVSMGTDHNKEIVNNMGLLNDEIKNSAPNDLVIVFDAKDKKTSELAMEAINNGLYSSKNADNDDEEFNPYTLETALKYQSDPNLALLSIPGEHVYFEAMKCLKNDLNVMIFSDNVPIESERKLKEYAFKKGLIVMGADCGTAIIDGKPLAFANNVRKGKIGIVGASGTGIQEVSVNIHKLGFGISQAIGTGGRDLSKEIGGITMLSGFDMLINDKETEVIVLISKPPEESVALKILEKVKTSPKKVIVNFLGGNMELIEKYNGIYAPTLEEASIKACQCIDNNISDNVFSKKVKIEDIIKNERSKYNNEQKYLRGLYTGGTLCKESILLLNNEMPIYSNIPVNKKLLLKDSYKSIENTIVDLGEDEFTSGKPHPMIDPEARAERIVQEGKDKNVKVVLLDIMLGYGSHNDPADSVVKAINKVKEFNNNISFVAAICGVDNDPQNYVEQKEKLEKAGVIIMPTNFQAVSLVKELIK